MEIYWISTSYAYITIDMYLKGYVLYRYAKPFLEKRTGSFCIGIAYFAVMMGLYLLPIEMSNFVAYSLGIFVSFLVMCKIDRRNICQKVFIAVTFFSLRWLSAYMTTALYGGVNSRIIESPYMIARPALELAAFIGVSILELVTGFAILAVSVRLIIRAYIYKHENMTVKEMLMLIMPSVAGMTEYVILRYYQDFYENSTGEIASGFYGALAFAHYGISILSIVVMTVIFQNIKARQEETLQNELLAAQIESIRQHIGQVESLYQDIRSIRHDMTNHILTLEQLYAENESKEAKNYAGNLKAALTEMAGEMKSGNPVTDVILQEQKGEAKKRDIQFQCDFHYPADSDVNAFDISVILNNALQNAIENAKSSEPSYVSLLSYRRKNAYMIEIRNSFAGNLRWDEESGLPITAKERRDGHGYGLKNVRRVAEKYAGDIDIMQEEGEFRLVVMLMLECVKK